MSNYKNDRFEGDISIRNNATIGGSGRVRNSMRVSKDVVVGGRVVCGWVNSANMGLYASLDELKTTITKPKVGMYAQILIEPTSSDKTFKAEVYRYQKGTDGYEWKDTGSVVSIEWTQSMVDGLYETYLEPHIGSLLDEKVDKVAGKGLSSNDYTTGEKAKLAGIEAGATVGATAEQVARIAALESGVLDKVDISQLVDMETKTHAAATYQPKGNYAAADHNHDGRYLMEHQDISGKADKTEVPTKVSQLVNDSGFINQHQDISGKVDRSEISDMETKTHAAATYQEKGSYLTEHQDISGKVDKVEGKGLSSNDYTTEEKEKLEQTLIKGDILNIFRGKGEFSPENPITYKIFSIRQSDGETISEAFTRMLIGANEYIDSLHKGFEGGTGANFPHGLVRVSFAGSEIWVINIVNSYSEDIVTQISLNGKLQDIAVGDTSKTLLAVASGADNGLFVRRHTSEGWTQWAPYSKGITEEQLSRLSAVESGLDRKVDKEDGKGLSSNDYTDADKQKLDGIEDMVSASVEIERQRALSAENDVAGRIPVAISQEIQGEDNVRYPFRSAAMEKFSLTLKNATTESHGLMSKSDKQKLDGFTFDAENGRISFGGKTYQLTEYVAAPTVTSESYSDPVISLSYAKIPASGGTVSPVLTYTQTKTKHWSNGNTTTENITTGGTVAWSGATNSANGSVTASATTNTTEQTIATVTATVTVNGKTASKGYTVKQEAYVVPDYVYIGKLSSTTSGFTGKSQAVLSAITPEMMSNAISAGELVRTENVPNAAGVDVSVNKLDYVMMLCPASQANQYQAKVHDDLINQFIPFDEVSTDTTRTTCGTTTITLSGVEYKMFAFYQGVEAVLKINITKI